MWWWCPRAGPDATLSVAPDSALTFGAWCDREYGFEYEGVRTHGGLAWHALLDDDGRMEWHPNARYLPRDLSIGPPHDYRELGLEKGTPIYVQTEKHPAAIQWVSDPGLLAEEWREFTPCNADACGDKATQCGRETPLRDFLVACGDAGRPRFARYSAGGSTRTAPRSRPKYLPKCCLSPVSRCVARAWRAAWRIGSSSCGRLTPAPAQGP